jgi:hypothetical protein
METNQTPSLPDAAPRSHRPRCGGRESKFLAASSETRVKFSPKGFAYRTVIGWESETLARPAFLCTLETLAKILKTFSILFNPF